MTLDEMVTQVAQRLNLTSTAALARIAKDIQECYGTVLGAVGMPTSSRGVVHSDTEASNQYLTFYSVQKLLSVFKVAGQPLWEKSFDEMRLLTPGSGSPNGYAISTIADNSVTIFFDNVPSAIETVYADALLDLSALQGGDSPAFPNLYHDMLVHGAMEIELNKMEKPDLADREGAKFQGMLGDLRYFIAKSAYLSRWQGKTGGWNGSMSWLGY